MKKFKKSRFIKKIKGWRGNAALYELSEPYFGNKKVVVSAVKVPFSGPETLIFSWNEGYGCVTNWIEIQEVKGCLSHQLALAQIGYYIDTALP